ncbi:hypothetical protein QUR76_08140 [Arcobacter cryaerophilus gv. pseudocryaerophilus]|uniref:Uncharacterized protein n=3 Tax=unclassified Arcobacter TaxID=2593671 RepID=A0AA96IEV4_9BACT|nr:hypothetical protein RMQ65_10780 [Arcobacter sp. AZ-2023]WPD05092.1 hypothetical protein QUR76_08140 [Arcobacter sp. DSM 115956]WPD07186.1 hypothetical protein QUR78_08135 [Arcobacter sp. DSM 115955]WNL31451.1 hypothetical protein RMQ67_08135 [Arcobacter sp. AZ-2023]WNP37601.1 hypothetical protein RJG58_08135 [Arcobacter sp. AZ-2023]
MENKFWEYWATFENIENNIHRFDTRVYLKQINNPSNNDICLGAIVGKNPGSARGAISNDLVKIDLQRDQLLRTVKNIFEKAYKKCGKEIPENSYIQVLNLFYLCDADLNNAIKKYENSTSKIDESENKQLSNMKDRFNKINSKKHFYLDPRNDCIKENIPSNIDLAKHTQGMRQEKVIDYISKILK